MITDVQILITLVVIIAIPTLYKIWFKNNLERYDRVLISLIGMPMVSIFVALIIFFNLRFLDTKTTESYKTICYIASIKNTNEITANFTLGFGSVEQKEYYYYFYKTHNGGYARGKKNVNRTIIVEDDSKQPHIEVLTTSYESKSGLFKYNNQSEDQYKIIVPKGTIVSKFELY